MCMFLEKDPRVFLLKNREIFCANRLLETGNKPITATPSTANGWRTPVMSPHKAGSWRQAIFQQVKTPNQGLSGDLKSGTDRRIILHGESRTVRTREDYRQLWKQAIKQQILLVRMEKENKRLKGKRNKLGGVLDRNRRRTYRFPGVQLIRRR